MKLRNNLSGKLRFKSFIPPRIEDYKYEADPARLLQLSDLFDELNSMLTSLSEDEGRQLIDLEAKDSWHLADDRPRTPFSFAMPGVNVNAENIALATVYGAGALGELPISTRLIRNIHYMICAGPDYDKKYRGEYRNSPVWIGGRDRGLQDADFVPPVYEDMTAAISDLENYLNYSDDNPFVKAALIHYQFEMIHPFIDGNGRTGRLLNTLFLMDSGQLSAPVLLLSHVIARDYERYCESLQLVNQTGDIQPWLSYWLETLAEAADYTRQIIAASQSTY